MHLHVRHAQEAEDGPQVRCHEVVGRHRAGGVDPAGGHGDVDFLPLHQALGPGLRVPEGNPRPGDVINPRFQERRYGEAVHRRADHDGIRFHQFGDGGIGVADGLALRGRMFLFRGEERLQVNLLQVGEGRRGEIAHGQGAVGVGGGKLRDDRVA